MILFDFEIPRVECFWNIVVTFQVGASIFGSNIGSEHFIGLAGARAATGIVLVLFEWLVSMVFKHV